MKVKLDNLIFTVFAAAVIAYVGWLGVQGILLAHDRITEVIERVAQ